MLLLELSMRVGTATYSRDSRRQQQCCLQVSRDMGSNSSEGIWLILKERVRKHAWNSLRELKAIIQQVWAEIDQDEIRRRIDEMPWRCKQLIETGGLPIKSELW